MASPSTLPSEHLSLLLLSALSTTSTIPDSRNLSLPNPGSPDAPPVLVRPGHDQLVLQGTLNSLAEKNMVEFNKLESELWVLTEEAEGIVREGSHEYRLWEALQTKGEEGIALKDLPAIFGGSKEKTSTGQSHVMKNKWATKVGDRLKASQITPTDATRLSLEQIQQTGTVSEGTKPDAKDLGKRKLCEKKKQIYFSISKGAKFATTIEKQETDLTVELLQGDAWKTASFKKYNFAAEGAPPNGGALHPLMKVREEFRNIFFEMGFREMPTNKFVESCFWNFDALFVPQQHPAREMQDTFYVKEPSTASHLPQDYLSRVSRVHSSGSFSSLGHRTPFSIPETEKLVLRTHTTSVSAQMLYQLANQEGGFKPAKMFSIDRVFRNEAVDATHLAEFHQVEGVIADRGLTLADLIGFMEIFFAKMGVTNLRFKPAYNPYTEPSLEIFSYHAGLGKWVEIGNSGMFRPEMLLAMGLPPDVRVHGWGLSLERPTMIRYGISNIRELLGHKVPLERVEQSPAVRF